MLTADQISALRDRSEQLLDPVINFLIEDIARRVKEAGQLTGTASYQTWRLQHLGMSQRQLKKEIAKRLEISLADAEKLLTQAADTDYNFDISRFPNTQAIPLSANSSLQQILAATVAQAREDLTNMTQTMGFVGADGICRPLTQAYQQACDFAFQKISTGAQDYVSAIRDATWGLAEKGIRTIDYKSGYHISIEAAVRQNMMGGMGIMQNHIAQNNHDTLGCNGWEISAHENSAPDHEPIQGKQYSDAEYESLNNSLARRIGTLHCGHYASPIILGVHSPQYTDEELEDMRRRNEEGVTFDGRRYTGFEATQRQRKFERSIRKQQRRILIDEVAEDIAKLQTDQIRLQRLKQEYKRFSEGVDLPMQYERLDTAGFTWKHAKAAQNAARRTSKFEETLENIAKSSTINSENSSRLFLPDDKQPKENRLPNSLIAATDQNKIQRYALNSNHPHGKDKAKVFNSVLGYHFENWDKLSNQIFDLLQTSEVSKYEVTKYGTKYVVPMRIHGERKKSMVVNTVWQIDKKSDIPRLITMTFDKRTIRGEG